MQASRSSTIHTSVLLPEVIAGLAVRPGDRDIDATVGLGGHAAAILRANAPDGRLLGIDADPAAVGLARQRLSEFGDRAQIVQTNFRRLEQVATNAGFAGADGLLLDLGVSSLQLNSGERGFSFQQEGPLDMRMDPSLPQSAGDLVNGLDEAELAAIISRYGEEPRARRVAQAIVQQRPLRSTTELAQLVAGAIGRPGMRIHPATRTFQALRIAVNRELETLSATLPVALSLLRSGARLAILSFHSLEDRIVKDFLRRESRDCLCPPSLPACVCTHRARLRLVSKGAIQATPAEIAANPRSRSARLRLAERL